MNYLWKKTYNTGIKEIDDQHKKFFELINKLYSENSKQRKIAIVSSIIMELEDYASYHFKYEEDLFTQYNYPEFEIELHLEKHSNFTKRILKYKEEVYASEDLSFHRLAEFLRKWLIDHILVTDMRFANYVKDNNLSNYYM